jgi:hypothetical protein
MVCGAERLAPGLPGDRAAHGDNLRGALFLDLAVEGQERHLGRHATVTPRSNAAS